MSARPTIGDRLGDDGWRVLLGIVLAALAWWAVGLPAFSGAATVIVLASGTAAMVVGGRERRTPTRTTTRPRRGLGAWAALGATLVLWQLAAFAQHPRSDHPTLSSLTNALLDSHLARAMAFVLWLAAARELARR